jgi:ketosteroid isomerase-like protein
VTGVQTCALPISSAEPPLGEGGAAARALDRGLADLAAWTAALPDDGVLISTDGAIATGKKALARAGRRLAGVRLAPSSAIAAIASGDGQLALATCLAQRTATPAPSKRPGKPTAVPPPVTVRVTAILRRDGATWQLLALAEAHAVAAKK